MPHEPTPRTSDTGRPAEPYVLVADADAERAALCLKILKEHAIGVLATTTGEEARRILDRFGPPVLLLIDLSLTGHPIDVIEAASAGDVGPSVVAWSPTRDVREFAANRLAGLNVRILRESARPEVVRGAIAQGLAGHDTEWQGSPAGPSLTSEELYDLMTAMASDARTACPAPGIAVYARAPGSAQFRASVTWWSEMPMPHAPTYLARVFDWVVESGRSLIAPDLTEAPLLNLPASALSGDVRGLAAVPIVAADGEVIGTLCVFDIEPLEITDTHVRALEALGRGGVVRPRDFASRPAETLASPDARAPDTFASGAALRESPATPVAPLLSRQHGEFAIAREVARARRGQQRLSIVLFHVWPIGRADPAAANPTGDLLLTTGETLLRAIRQADLPVHWDKDELLLVLPGLGAPEARLVAERVRAVLQAGGGYRLAVSGGVAELQADESFGDAAARAAEQMRRARDAGRNHVA